jgi:hypothetical protein
MITDTVIVHAYEMTLEFAVGDILRGEREIFQGIRAMLEDNAMDES